MAYSSEIYEALYTELKKTDAVQLHMERVSAQRIKATRAGEMLYLKSYPMWTTPADGRRAKQAGTTREVQRRLNQRTARLKSEMLINHNFGREDYVFTATYTDNPRSGMRLDDAYYAAEPQDETEAQENMSRFIRELRRLARSKGGDPKKLRWFYVTEATYSKHPDADGRARWHHHMLIGGDIGNGARISRDEIEGLWRELPFFRGGRTKCEWIQPGSAGLSGLAAYLTKTEDGIKSYLDTQGRKRNRMLCHHSRNLVMPQSVVSDRKLSRRRVAKVAEDVMQNGRTIFEQLYPDYECTDEPTVYISDYCAGAYIYCRMKRREVIPCGTLRRDSGARSADG